MSPKVFVVLLVILALACWYAAGVGIARDDKPAKDYQPSEGDVEDSIGGFLEPLLAPLSPKLDLVRLRPRQGAGFQLDPGKRTLSLAKASTCRLQVPADAEEQVRTAKLELTSGTGVKVLSWEGEDRPDDGKAQTLRRDEPMSLAFREKGGTLEVINASTGPAVLTFR